MPQRGSGVAGVRLLPLVLPFTSIRGQVQARSTMARRQALAIVTHRLQYDESGTGDFSIY